MKHLILFAFTIMAMTMAACGDKNETKIPDDYIKIDTTAFSMALPPEFADSYIDEVEKDRFITSHKGHYIQIDVIKDAPAAEGLKDYITKLVKEKSDMKLEPIGEPVVSENRAYAKFKDPNRSTPQEAVFFIVAGENGKGLKGYVAYYEEDVAKAAPETEIIINSMAVK